jgi:D-glycero-D-manno-heptose 1,7-bisphosphate phosphatase
MSFIQQIDHTWTLFLDRDGVINEEKHQDYIRNPEEFHFYAGVPDAICRLRKKFGLIVIVTNQRGIGRGLMNVADLDAIHQVMNTVIEDAGGKIDAIYHAADVEIDAPDRKPNTGMGIKAKMAFPQIEFSKCVMVGNNLSDIEFGKKLGMKTVFVETTQQLEHKADIDLVLPGLVAFADLLT